jgi:hypothetical protein
MNEPNSDPVLTPTLQEEADGLELKVRIAHRWLKAFADEKKKELVMPSIGRSLPYCARLLAIVTEAQALHIPHLQHATMLFQRGDGAGLEAHLAQSSVYQEWIERVHTCVETYQEDVGKWYDFIGADRPG